MTALGYLVFAKRPKPSGGYSYEIVTMRDGTNMAVATLEGAQNVKESCEAALEPPKCCGHKWGCHECGVCQVVLNDGPPEWGNPPKFCQCPRNDLVEYVIGEIGEWSGR